MNRGIIIKAIRETWLTTLLFGLGILFLEGIFAVVLPTFQERLAAQWMQMPFVQTIIKAIAGTDVSGGIGPEVFAAIGWVHPVALAITWAHATVYCTRVPVGEIDRGTIDVLLGLPVSRWTLYLSESAVWLLSSAALLGMAFLGNRLGALLVEPGLRAPAGRIFIVAVNLWMVYLAIGAGAWLASTLSDRRGRAIGWILVAILASFLLNYLAQLWEPARRIWFLSILRYHRPVEVLRGAGWSVRDMAVLLCIAAVLWAAAGVVFRRRDLSTV
jgi:beta-exotoxin I transport system permease protein